MTDGRHIESQKNGVNAAEDGKESGNSDVLRDHVVTEIGGDRRSRRRYGIDLKLQYKVVRRGRVYQSGSGRTVNFSGDGVAFESAEVLKPGSTVELDISWPVMLNSTCALRLVVTGKVVRSEGALTAVSMLRYEFRTQGMRAFASAAYPA